MTEARIADELLNIIKSMAEKQLSRHSFTYYIDAKVTAYDSSSNTYTLVNGESTYLKVPPRTGASYSTGDCVRVCVPNGSLPRKFIDDKMIS